MSPNVWVMRAEGGKWTKHFVNGGYVGGGWLKETDLSDAKDRGRLDQLYQQSDPERSPGSRGSYVGQVGIFLLDMKPGDYVITPDSDSRWLYYGPLADEQYYFSPGDPDGCWFSHRRKVTWAKDPLDRSEFKPPFRYTMGASKTAFHVRRTDEFLEKIGEKKHDDQSSDAHEVVISQILDSCDAKDLEELVGELMKAMGLSEVEVIGEPGDGGIDVTGVLGVLNLPSTKVDIQVKRYNQGAVVKAGAVDALAGAISSGGQGVIITTSDFDNNAKSTAKDRGIGLINGTALVDLLTLHWSGISEEFRVKLSLKEGLVRL